MSHTTTIKSVKVTDIPALERAVEHLNRTEGLGLRIRHHASCTLWFEQRPCRVVIDVPGVSRGLNVGFEGSEATGLTPVMDTHGGWIAKKLGAGASIAQTAEERNLAAIGKLMHAYAVETVRSVARNTNAMITEQFNAETGEMVLQLS